MTGFFLASQILLWIAVAVLGVLVAALARQVGVLHERIAPAGALTLHQKVNVGDMAPAMTLDTLNGGQVEIGGKRHRRGQLLFFLSPDCPVCKTLLPIVRSASGAEHDWLDVVLASDGDPAAHRRLAIAEGLTGFDYVLSEELGRSLGRSIGEFKRASNELRSTLDEEIRLEEQRNAERQRTGEKAETPQADEPGVPRQTGSA